MIVRTVTKIPVKGRRVPPGAITDFDALTPLARPQVDVWVAHRLLAGMHPKALAVAVDGALSIRTIYRWKRALVALEVVELAGMQATFAIRRGQAPARITAWEKAA